MTVAGLAALRAERDALLVHGDESVWNDVCRHLGDVVDLGTLDSLQVPVAGDLLRDFGPLGKHPSHLWADGLVYASVVHRCFDAGGPVFSASVGPAIAWFESALPQVARDGLHRVLDAPVALVLDAPRTLWRVGDGIGLGEAPEGVAAAAARIAVGPVALLRFGSGRSRWQDEDVRIEGDDQLARRTLDEVRI
ncbi:hypothetical protein [Actinospongicola halichondriae]|uniref:hypothetical protein n=1 Tax=Actinospongicola halichondriae TaxID=3236844 RepID=UPI003D485AE1